MKFEIGQKYEWTDWFTGGQKNLTVSKRSANSVTFKYVVWEADGIWENEEEFEIITDDNGNEMILMCEYHGKKGYVYAKE